MSMIRIKNWKEALSEAREDPDVHIKIAPLTGDASMTMYVTELPPYAKVSAHMHQEGLEIYHILQGEGELYTGKLKSDNSVSWDVPLRTKTGDFFTIPSHTIHQLRNTSGNEKLVLVFGCPHSHLTTDRLIVADYPGIKE